MAAMTKKRKPGRDWWLQAASPKTSDSINISSGKAGDVLTVTINASCREEKPSFHCDGVFLFDELAIKHPDFHLEQMNTREWWLSLGGYIFWIKAEKDGTTTVTHDGQELGQYGLTK